MPFDEVQVITVESEVPGAPMTITVQVPGVQGPPGAFKLGTVTTGDPGTDASATTAPDPTNPDVQVVNLVIPRGDVGTSNTLTIGTITTLAAGSPATATLTGTSPNQTLSLGIPAGAKGDTGATGATNSLAIGTVSTLAAGAAAAASITGTAPNQILNLSIPQGAQGDTGSTGPANTLTIGTVTTGASGSQATATITGTAPNQVLNLTIPQGPAGTAAAGLAPGGAAGAIATKNTAADYDVGWSNPASAATASAIMIRDANGRASVADPSASTDIATKNYADTADTTTLNSAKTYTDGKTWPSSAITDAKASGLNGPGLLTKFDANGRIQVATPSGTSDVTTKGYVDSGDGKALGYAYTTTAFNGASDGSTVKVTSMPSITVSLTAGRLYKAVCAGRFSNNTAAGATYWMIKSASGSSTTASSICVADGRTIHVYAGGVGQMDYTFSGYFAVGVTGTYTFDSYISSGSGNIPALTTDARGRYDVMIEDAGPLNGLGVITI